MDDTANCLYAVIEHSHNFDIPDINYILDPNSFQQAFSGMDFGSQQSLNSVREESLIHNASTESLMPRGFAYQEGPDSMTKHISVLTVPMDDPAEAANNLSKFLNGFWNRFGNVRYEVALNRCSPEAIRGLGPLLKPFALMHEVTPGDKRSDKRYFMARDSTMTRNVENVLVKLDLMDLERVRYSATQCTAYLKVNHHNICVFEDAMWLQTRRGTLSNGYREIPNRPMYGPVVAGYGSLISDGEYRRAAIMKVPERIAEELDGYGRNRLKDMLQDASKRVSAQAKEKGHAKIQGKFTPDR